MEAGPHPRPGHCCKPGGRLDMNHGFVHHIRRNQIARDDYDKKVKQAAKEKVRRRHTPAPTRPRKPDLQVYLPRHRGSAHLVSFRNLHLSAPKSPLNDSHQELGRLISPQLSIAVRVSGSQQEVYLPVCPTVLYFSKVLRYLAKRKSGTAMSDQHIIAE
ncbi:UPF0561 protein C2orf68 isoform X1 [Homo sapiens]|uniref:UPF0561 protein C2orf68 isoform X1 n=1 Tax=Homo sapiens TaxID=9606 RepID=UPI000387CDE8|nr:UPF0561 protein C2orf68 isoform X1 [Homo sapiens]XP_024308647.1 UPF0561 protein C2orf68 isoform X1 [Homo sapiens]XP_054197936.1 UPF0561 protein C2orf68 isoform X1 [Homo sapiens]XP_054197937.1 UPF0561 protein C2orf68 isoform X1 [Homo sapiens]|eukprot:XP_005264362.1 UPF0561 protein C2orf68 isoform X1 [Homo sapiens]